MSEFLIEKDSPIVGLRSGKDFGVRAKAWCAAAHKLVSEEIARERDMHGCGEEVSLLLTNRQADHLALGLGILGTMLRTVQPAPRNHAVPDGLYRVEFVTAEPRGAASPVTRIDLAAEVTDGAGKGLQLGETVCFTFGGFARGLANEAKVAAYVDALGLGNPRDTDDWLFRPFAAEVIDRRVVAISDGKSAFHHLPVGADAPRAVEWDENAGWSFVSMSEHRRTNGTAALWSGAA